MSDGHEYRPKSPDLSALDAPPPRRISRLPSIQNPADASFSHGFAFSPRGSYDASPFFSPQTTTPSATYFDYRGSTRIPQAQSPPAFQPTPLPPAQTVNSAAYHAAGQLYPQSGIAPDNFQPQYQQPFSPQFSSQNPFQQFPPYPTEPSLTYVDMARTRQRKVEDHDPAYDPAYEPHAHAARTAVPVKAEPQMSQAPPPPMGHEWQGVEVRTKFPVARIKRIMQADEDVGKVAQATPTAVSKALELFMITLVTKGATEAKAQNSRRVTAQHLKAALMKDGQYDFLTEICENVVDETSKKGRAKSEAKSEDSDGDIAGTKKKKAAKKRKADSDEDSD